MHIVHILYRFGSFGIVLVGLVKGPTDLLIMKRYVNCTIAVAEIYRRKDKKNAI